LGYRLLKRENIFYARVWVPADVRGILHKRERKKSLRTACGLRLHSKQFIIQPIDSLEVSKGKLPSKLHIQGGLS
jgi:hypothetical protein